MIKYKLSITPNDLFLCGYCKIQLNFVVIEKNISHIPLFQLVEAGLRILAGLPEIALPPGIILVPITLPDNIMTLFPSTVPLEAKHSQPT